MPGADPLPTDREPTALELLTYCRAAHTEDALRALESYLDLAPPEERLRRFLMPQGPCVVLSDGYMVQVYTDEAANSWGDTWMAMPSALDRDLMRTRLMYLQTVSRGAEQDAWDAAHEEQER